MQSLIKTHKFRRKNATKKVLKFMLLFILLFFIIFGAIQALCFSAALLPSDKQNTLKPLYLSLPGLELQSNTQKADPAPEKTNVKSTFLNNISTIRIKNSLTKKILEIDLDEYITGVVLAEVPQSFEFEAIKAQAVAARSYAVSSILSKTSKHQTADVCSDYRCCQAYISKEAFLNKYGQSAQKIYDNANAAVKETSKIIMLYNGAVVQAFFHAASGKSTYSSEDVWGTSLDYLKPVPAPEAQQNPSGYITSSTFEAKDVELLSGHKKGSLPMSSFVSKQNTNSEGLVTSVKIADAVFSGNKIRSLFGLKSACFEIHTDDTQNTVTFTCYGSGHGVGMSQHGANILAKQGYDYMDILKYYYTDIYFGFV